MRKYTKELLEPIADSSHSIADVLRKLGVKQRGSTQALIKKRLIEYEIDFSHFTGQASNRGEFHSGGAKKKHWRDVLIIRKNGIRERAYALRRALIEMGREYKCFIPGCPVKRNMVKKRYTSNCSPHKRGFFKL